MRQSLIVAAKHEDVDAVKAIINYYEPYIIDLSFPVFRNTMETERSGTELIEISIFD